MSGITQKKLERFIKMRNKSGFQSNLQFQFDADACGLKVADFGPVTKHEEGFYSWDTPCGRLIERFGKMWLDDSDDEVREHPAAIRLDKSGLTDL